MITIKTNSINQSTVNNNTSTNMMDHQSIANNIGGLSSHNSFTRKIIVNPNNSGNSTNRKTSASSQQKYSNKNRSSNQATEEFVMLQRPTILLKQPIISSSTQSNQSSEKEQENLNSKQSIVLTKENVLKKQISQQAQAPPQTPSQSQQYAANNENIKPLMQIKIPVLNDNLSNTSAAYKQPNHPIAQPSPQPQVLKDTSFNTTSSSFTDSLSSRLGTIHTVVMKKSCRLLDENLQFVDNLNEFLLDQSDYLVVGVLGKRGVGKSTLMSLLACCESDSASKYVFAGQNKTSTTAAAASSNKEEMSQHKTSGIQAFVTNERTILLDVQPILSASLVDKSISIEKQKSSNATSSTSNASGGSSNSNEFKYYENLVEMQSIELTCFILSVCNVVLVTEDWFSDPNLFRLIQVAEMLMPSLSTTNSASGNTPTSSTNTSVVIDENRPENYPHLIYVLNKSEFINKLDLMQISVYIDSLMKDSKLNYKGSLFRSSRIASNRERMMATNCLIMPLQDHNKEKSELSFSGLPSLEKSAKNLLRDILALKRSACFNLLNLTEKRWMVYASKVWDAIRRSQLIGEYSRLMT